MNTFSAGSLRPTSVGAAQPQLRPVVSLSAGDRPTSLDARRRRPRRHTCDDCHVNVVDGPLAGQTFECVFREVSPETASLLVRAEIRVGQRVRIQSFTDGQPSGEAIPAEVIRSRALTTGRHEVLVEYRKPAEAPKPSESQRRHERRQARLASLTGGNAPITRATL